MSKYQIGDTVDWYTGKCVSIAKKDEETDEYMYDLKHVSFCIPLICVASEKLLNEVQGRRMNIYRLNVPGMIVIDNFYEIEIKFVK